MEPKDVRIVGRPIEITEDSFSVLLGSGLHVPKDSTSGIPPSSSWHMSKRASDLEEAAVPPDQVEALRWLREKRGRIDFGKAYTHQDPYGVRVQVPVRPVTIQFPYFGYKLGCNVIETSGATLSEAVASAVAALVDEDPMSTYPGRNVGFDRVLAKIGDAEVRVADLCGLIRDYYGSGHSTGGALHCVLDDGNMEDGHIYSMDPNDKAAVLIAELLKRVPEDERKRLYERGYGR